MTIPTPLPAQGRRDFPSPQSYVHRTTAALDMVYTGAVNQTAHGAASQTRDVLRARPFVWPGGYINAMYMEATAVVANAVGRCGVYTNTDDKTLYPSSRVFGGSELALATATVAITLAGFVLAPGLYWFVNVCGVADPTLRTIAVGGVSHIGGMSSAFALQTQLAVAFPYAALPSSFPAGATWDTAAPAVVGMTSTE